MSFIKRLLFLMLISSISLFSASSDFSTQIFSIHEENGVSIDTFELTGVYNENIVLESGTLIINGEVTIAGDLIIEGGIVDINGEN